MGKIPSREELNRALSERVGEELFEKLSSAVVAVCGLGGLGSNIAVSLARAGVGKLILIDFDRVDITNLNRQQYKITQLGEYKTAALEENLCEIMPYIRLEMHNVRLDSTSYARYLSGADIICEAFDIAEEKSSLVNFVLENMPEKYIISASGVAGLGSAEKIKTRKITDKFYICGNGTSDTERGESLFSARTALCAAHQALVALRIIGGMEGIENEE